MRGAPGSKKFTSLKEALIEIDTLQRTLYRKEQEAEELVSSTEVSAAKSSETVTRLARAFKGMKAKAAEHATDAASLRAQVAKLEHDAELRERREAAVHAKLTAELNALRRAAAAAGSEGATMLAAAAASARRLTVGANNRTLVDAATLSNATWAAIADDDDHSYASSSTSEDEELDETTTRRVVRRPPAAEIARPSGVDVPPVVEALPPMRRSVKLPRVASLGRGPLKPARRARRRAVPGRKTQLASTSPKPRTRAEKMLEAAQRLRRSQRGTSKAKRRGHQARLHRIGKPRTPLRTRIRGGELGGVHVEHRRVQLAGGGLVKAAAESAWRPLEI